MDRDHGRLCNREVFPGGGIQRGSSGIESGEGPFRPRGPQVQRP